MAYINPPFNNVPFTFTSSGYTAPDFNNVNFNIRLRSTYQQTADMQSIVRVFGPSNSIDTYTYVKEQKTYVIGYSRHGVQILKGRTIYGGIRDLYALLVSELTHVDLNAYISSVIGQAELASYVNVNFRSSLELLGFLHGWSTVDLISSISGWYINDLTAYIGIHPPADLQALLNVIEVYNLPSNIVGEWWHGDIDLPTIVHRIFKRDYTYLTSSVFGWAERLLGAYLNPVRSADLNAAIFSGTFKIPKNLGASIYPNPLGNLNGIIHGLDIFNLYSSIIGVFSPSDLQASIYGVPTIDLFGVIGGFRGLRQPYNLQARIESYCTSDLSSIIDIIHPADLAAFIQAYGRTLDLGASIVPKTILIRRVIQVALLEHLNLNAIINYMCGGSAGINLSAYVYPLMKKDLTAGIIGWYGSVTDNLLNLNAYINVKDYTVYDSFRSITFTSLIKDNLHSNIPVLFTSYDGYKVLNTIPIYFNPARKMNLSASIEGILTSKNLAATLNPIFDWNYTDLPPWIIPKTHEVVLDIEHMEEQWRRFVEIMFDNSGVSENGDVNFVYFYVNGTQKVYRLDRNRHWTIWVKSYLTDEESMIERKLVRYKYTFNLSKYATIDEAVRDLIDRVSTYRVTDLAAIISSQLPIGSDLGATISVKPLRKWIKQLNSTITGII